MSCNLDAAKAPRLGVFRVAREPDPFEWPDWSYAADDRTFGNRWDDPEGAYRVVYASSDRLGAFVETLARFRPDPSVVAAMKEIAGSEATIPAGIVPKDWLDTRFIGRARLAGPFADVSRSGSLAWLRAHMADRLHHYRLPDLDAGTVRLTAPRRFTQEISRAAYECSVEGERVYSGITYLSRLGD